MWGIVEKHTGGLQGDVTACCHGDPTAQTIKWRHFQSWILTQYEEKLLTLRCEEVVSSPSLGAYKKNVPNRMSCRRFKHQVQIELHTLTFLLTLSQDEPVFRMKRSMFETGLSHLCPSFSSRKIMCMRVELLWRWWKWQLQCIKQRNREIPFKSLTPTCHPKPLPTSPVT